MKKKLIKLSLASTALILGLFLAVYFQDSMTTYPVERSALANPEDLRQIPEPTTVSSRLLFGGDIMLGRKVETTSLASTLSYAYPFQKLDTLEPDMYQAWIANLECPSTNTVVPYYEQTTYLRFNCPTEYLPELAKWFDVVSLSNNHTDNVNGNAGLLETREHLDENSIQYFGHYDNSVKADICEVVTVDAIMSYTDGSTEVVKLPIAMCGLHGVFKIPLDSEIAVISDFAEFLPTFVMPHMGAEYEPSHDNIRQTTYRKMVDAGADAVIGNHPHWVQNTEVYEDKLIVYSMGNLIFDQQFSAEVQRSAMLDVTINAQYNENTLAWVKLAATCVDFHDDCLIEAEKAGLSKLDVSFDYDVVATQLIDMIVRKANEATTAGVLDRTNWQTTSTKLDSL